MVTGVGAIIGYGLVRSLRATMPDIRLLGTDIYPDAVGQAWCDEFEQAPLTASAGYLEWLRCIVNKHQVDLLIPGIEQDVHRLSADRECVSSFNCQVALNNACLIDLSRDKWAMHEELRQLGDTSRIPSYLAGDYSSLVAQLGLPFILKPRRSYASKGLVRIKCQSDFTEQASRLGDHLMAQPIIGSDDEEFTVGIFGDGQGHACASITMQRRLAQDGSTAKAWIRKHESIDEVVLRLCAHFKPVGPTNLQFRRDGSDWKLLEINPRISSSSSIRTAFGYNEALMSVEFFLNGKLPAQPVIREGFAVRFIEDYVVYDRDHF